MGKRFILNRLILLFFLTAVFVAAGGVWFYQAQELRLRQRTEGGLADIAQLKVNEIHRWRELQIANAQLVVDNPYFFEAAARIIRQPAAWNSEVMMTWLKRLKDRHGYRDIFLVNAAGTVRRRLETGPAQLSSLMMAAMEEAQRLGKPMLTDLHPGDGNSAPHLDVVAPLFEMEGRQRRIFGALFLRIDAKDFLYKILGSSPLSGQSGETLLIRKDGDAVLFLNDLRHQSDTALKLRIPLDRKEVPAVMAVLGKEGIVEGPDYRGVKVVSVLKAIPDSPWFLITKMDQTEIFSQWRFSALLIIVMILGILAALAGVVGMLWQRNEKAHYRRLFREEEGHRITLMSIGDGVIATDQEGRITMLNPVAETLTGLTQADACGKFVEEAFRIVNEETRLAVENPVRRVLQEGAIAGLANHTLLIARDGRELPIADAGSPILDEEGRIAGVALIFRDQTREREVETALRRSEERFRLAFQTSPDAITINRLEDGMYEDANDGFTELSGYTREEVIGRTSLEMNVWCNPADREEMIRVLKEKGHYNRLHTDLRSKDGSVKTVVISSRIIKFKEVPHLISITRDITEHLRDEERQKNLEERLQRAEKMEALGVLAGGVAHDLNNVLGILVGYSELLLSDVDPNSRLYAYTQNIMNSGERAAAIVQDLLTLARRGIHSKSTLDLNKIITDQLQTPECSKLSSLYPQVVVTTALEPDLLPVMGSDVHLGKILTNLLLNAVEAIPGAGTVAIETHNRYLDRPVPGYDEVCSGDYVVLSVSDTGEGIPPINLKRIFEPFYTKKVMGRSGTGLGLAVVWGAVRDHNGYIHVQSDEGRGTTMTVYFPVSREEVAADLPVEASEYMGSGESILVVDDVAEQRELAISMLERLNYRVDTAASGEEALAYLRERPVDIVVLDMIMDPGMDGLETYQGMLKIRPGQKAVIVSGYAETERVRLARELGAGPYVRKPYIRERIGMAIRGELDRR